VVFAGGNSPGEQPPAGCTERAAIPERVNHTVSATAISDLLSVSGERTDLIDCNSQFTIGESSNRLFQSCLECYALFTAICLVPCTVQNLANRHMKSPAQINDGLNGREMLTPLNVGNALCSAIYQPCELLLSQLRTFASCLNQRANSQAQILVDHGRETDFNFST